MENLYINQHNEVFLKLQTTVGMDLELSSYFSAYVTGYRFMPNYINHRWDGKIRFYSMKTKLFPIGMLDDLMTFCKKYGYKPVFNFDYQHILFKPDWTKQDTLTFISGCPISTEFVPRDYQIDSVDRLIRVKRAVTQLNTGLGKSLVLYILTLYALSQKKDVLIIVPNIGLVEQMFSDFKSYGMGNVVNKIVEKKYSKAVNTNTNCPVLLSTWQSLLSIQKKRPEYFERFGAVLIDEVHGVSDQAYAIREISKACSKAEYRWGCTGTLPKEKSDLWSIKAYVGMVVMETKTADFIERGILSDLKIVNLFAKYPVDVCKKVKELGYHEEADFTMDYKGRNKLLDYIIQNSPKEENILLLVTHIEKQLTPIKEYISRLGRVLRVIDGSVNGADREKIRTEMENSGGNILLATFGTVSTGINLKRLHTIIFFSSYRSTIKVLQSIGRILRLHETKKQAILWDVIDDLRYKKHKNHIFKQWEVRAKIYKDQGFKTFDKVIQI